MAEIAASELLSSVHGKLSWPKDMNEFLAPEEPEDYWMRMGE